MGKGENGRECAKGGQAENSTSHNGRFVGGRYLEGMIGRRGVAEDVLW